MKATTLFVVASCLLLAATSVVAVSKDSAKTKTQGNLGIHNAQAPLNPPAAGGAAPSSGGSSQDFIRPELKLPSDEDRVQLPSDASVDKMAIRDFISVLNDTNNGTSAGGPGGLSGGSSGASGSAGGGPPMSPADSEFDKLLKEADQLLLKINQMYPPDGNTGGGGAAASASGTASGGAAPAAAAKKEAAAASSHL